MDPRLSDARAPVISKLAAFLFFFSSIFSRIFLLPTVPHIKLINSRFVYLKHLKRTRLRMISVVLRLTFRKIENNWPETYI